MNAQTTKLLKILPLLLIAVTIGSFGVSTATFAATTPSNSNVVPDTIKGETNGTCTYNTKANGQTDVNNATCADGDKCTLSVGDFISTWSCLTPSGKSVVDVSSAIPGVTQTITSDKNGNTTIQNGSKTIQQQNPPDNGGGGCSITNLNLGDCIFSGLGTVAYAILSLIGWLLGVVGSIFNWAIVITVFQFGFYFANSQGMLTAWGIIRDLANIIILFAFIFVGVMMILDLHSFDARRTLPRLIIFAVLLNFSLFIGEAVVDVANVLSSQIYLQAGSSTMTTTATCTGTGSGQTACNSITNTNASSGNNAVKVGIAGLILQEAGVGSIFSAPKIPSGQNGQALIVYSATALLLLILMAVLLAGAIMLFTRAIMLAFLLLLSPIAFAGMAVPQLEGRANEWWNKLLSNAFFAPVYLLLIFVGLKVMDATRTAIAGSSSANLMTAVIQGNSSITSIFILYALMVGFMIAAFMFARSSGVAGAAFATSFAQKAVQNAVVRPITAPIRGTVAGGAWLTRTAAGNAAQTGAHKYNELIGNLRKKGGIVGGIAKTADYMVGANIEHAAHNIETAKIGGKSFQDDRNNEKARDKETSHAAHQAHNRDDFNKGISAAKGTPAYDAAEKAWQDMSKGDREQLLKNAKQDAVQFAAAISNPDVFADVMKSDDITSTVKEQMNQGRSKEIRRLKETFDAAAVGTPAKQAAFDALATEISTTYTEKDIENAFLYDNNFATNTFGTLNPDGKGGSVIRNGEIINNVAKKTSLTSSARKLMNDTKKSEQLKKAIDAVNGGTGPATAVATLMSGKNMGKDVAEISEDKIFNGTVLTPAGEAYVNNLDGSAKLKGITDKAELSQGALDAIVAHVRTKPATDPVYKAFSSYLNGNAANFWGHKIP